MTSMDGVQTAFSALGMDAGMIQQFVPIVMGFLGNRGGLVVAGTAAKLMGTSAVSWVLPGVL